MGKKSSDGARLVITTILGVVFGFFVGMSFPSVSLTKVCQPPLLGIFIEIEPYIYLICFKFRRLTYLQALYHLLM